MTPLAHANTAGRQVPFGFFGMHPDRYTTNSPAVFDRELELMVAAGVETLRITIFWQFIQPWYVPPVADPDGLLSDFVRLDGIVAAAARRNLQLIPTIWGTPNWAASSNCALERDDDELTVFG